MPDTSPLAAAKFTLLSAGWVCALAAPPPVLAEAGAAALLASVAQPPVLAEAGAAALLALAALPPVLADPGATALLAFAASSPGGIFLLPCACVQLACVRWGPATPKWNTTALKPCDAQ